MSSDTGITFRRHTPESTVVGDVQEVRFSLDELPHTLIKTKLKCIPCKLNELLPYII